jgi:hypothetical protein
MGDDVVVNHLDELVHQERMALRAFGPVRGMWRRRASSARPDARLCTQEFDHSTCLAPFSATAVAMASAS